MANIGDTAHGGPGAPGAEAAALPVPHDRFGGVQPPAFWRIIGKVGRAGRRDALTGLCLALAVPMFIAGLVLPAMSVTQLFLFESSFSLWEALIGLATSGEFFLFAVMGLFSLAFPGGKLIFASALWLHGRPAGRLARALVRGFAAASRWSMLDVFIIAVTVMLVEGTLLSSAGVKPGIMLFAASVILSTVATHRLNRQHRD